MSTLTQAGSTPAQAPQSPSRMQSALDSLHNEVGTLEDFLASLEKKLTSVLEPVATQSNQNTSGQPPSPVHAVNVISAAELRVSAVRNRIGDMLDRLHV